MTPSFVRRVLKIVAVLVTILFVLQEVVQCKSSLELKLRDNVARRTSYDFMSVRSFGVRQE